MWRNDLPGAELQVEMMICGLVRGKLNHKEDLRALTSSILLAGLALSFRNIMLFIYSFII